MSEGPKILRIGQQIRIPGTVTMDIYGNPDKIHDGNIIPYPFKDNTFSRIDMFDVLNHLITEPEKVLTELYRISKHGCLIHISVPYWKTDIARHIYHHRQYRSEAFTELDNSVMEVNQTYRNTKPSFRLKLMKIWYKKGSRRFWKKYELHVIYRVIK